MMFNDPLSGLRHGDLRPGRLLAGDHLVHALLGRLRRDGAPGDDRRRHLLLHLVRVRPDRRPRRRGRHHRCVHAVHRRRQRRHVVLRADEHPRPVRRVRYGLAHLLLLLPRAHVPDHVLPRRDGRQDPRDRAARRDRHPHDLRLRRARPGRRPGRARLEALNPAGIFGGGEGVEGAARVFGVGARRHRLLRRLLVVGRLRDGAELRRGGPEPEEDDGLRHLHLLHRSRRPATRSGPGCSSARTAAPTISGRGRLRRSTGGRRGGGGSCGRGAAGGQLRQRLLPGRTGVRGRRHRGPLPGAHHHRLLRVLAGVLEHRQPVPLLDGPGGHPAEHPRPDAQDAQEPLRRVGDRASCSAWP